MSEVSGRHIIQSLQKRWNLQLQAAHLIIALAITILLIAIVVRTVGINWIVVLLLFVASLAVFYILYKRKISEQDVTRFLNHTISELQESAHLLLQPPEALNGMEKLQVKKVEHTLKENIPAPPLLIRKKIKASVIIFTAALLFTLILFIIPFNLTNSSSVINNSRDIIYSSQPEKKLSEIKAVNVKITPPRYTGKGTREQNLFNIVVEQKASVTWHVTTTQKAGKVQFVFNDKSILSLKPMNAEHTQWSAGKAITQPGFYQVSIDKKLSDLYKIEMIKDELPVITVHSPKPGTMIDFGEPKKVMVNVAIADDYGVADASIRATTASGSGEAVKFKEQQFPFSNFNSGNKQYHMQRLLDLSALGMQAGDELYFYVKAKDNNNQEKRSDVYIVRLADTAQLMSMAGMVSGVDIKPEFFRSQRQIIIETEQLLKDKDTISVEDFNKKSADLGVDQKLLRLRYGKFLGEESETEIGGDHEHDESEHHDASDIGDADKIIDQYSHKHDLAEDATFFDDATKKQLKATLDEMWKAELQLRLYKPKEALPFEYKALRLLKDLQQQTRSYVAKTGIKTTPLNPGKRLTGELISIAQPVINENIKQKDSSVMILRKGLSILEQLRSGENVRKAGTEILEQAGTQLSAKAASHPGLYLTAYQALRRVLENEAKRGDIDLVGSAFQRMIQSVPIAPQRSNVSPDMNLSQRYFSNLKGLHD